MTTITNSTRSTHGTRKALAIVAIISCLLGGAVLAAPQSASAATCRTKQKALSDQGRIEWSACNGTVKYLTIWTYGRDVHDHLRVTTGLGGIQAITGYVDFVRPWWPDKMVPVSCLQAGNATAAQC